MHKLLLPLFLSFLLPALSAAELNFCSSAMQNSNWRGGKFPAWIR